MHSTGIDRRILLGWMAAGLAAPLVPRLAHAFCAERLYLSARAGNDGGFHVSGLNGNGKTAFDLPLPDRGHSFAVHPSQPVAVHFARRPGTFAIAIDVAQGRVLHRIASVESRHFYGHGAFSPDGRLLYATENDFAGERGVIGVYDAANGYRRVAELPSHGIGPHELRLLADGTTLVVANGGILTRPDLPRVKLNIPTMSPSLAYIDRRDGRLLAEARLAPSLHQLSIRHLALGRGGMVAAVMQYEGPKGDLVPLVAVHRRGGEMRLFEGPEPVLQSMKGYCGSAAFDSGGTLLGVSSPRGGVLTFWEAATGRHLSSVAFEDGCGLAAAPEPGAFLASSGTGALSRIDARGGDRRPLPASGPAGARWDNHMACVDL